jgi:hypothetical protein
LLLFVAAQAFNAQGPAYIPDHRRMVEIFATNAALNYGILDSVMVLGWKSLEANGAAVIPADFEDFFAYVQRLSVLSAQVPLGDLRYEAYLLTTAILHSNPSSEQRFRFIRDTLEHVPFENLKVCAVGWLKGEILDAFGVERLGQSTIRHFRPAKRTGNGEKLDLFSDPSEFASIAKILFDPPRTAEGDPGEHLNLVPFYVSALNFYYLIYTSKPLYEGLQISTLEETLRIEDTFITRLAELSKDLRALAERDADSASEPDDGILRLNLLDAAIDKARDAFARANTGAKQM